MTVTICIVFDCVTVSSQMLRYQFCNQLIFKNSNNYAFFQIFITTQNVLIITVTINNEIAM